MEELLSLGEVAARGRTTLGGGRLLVRGFDRPILGLKKGEEGY